MLDTAQQQLSFATVLQEHDYLSSLCLDRRQRRKKADLLFFVQIRLICTLLSSSQQSCSVHRDLCKECLEDSLSVTLILSRGQRDLYTIYLTRLMVLAARCFLEGCGFRFDEHSILQKLEIGGNSDDGSRRFVRTDNLL